jgi:hypothetical protein
MKKKTIIIIISIPLFIMIVGTIVATIIGNHFQHQQEMITKTKKWYYYIPNLNPVVVNAGFILNDIDEKDKFVKYFREQESGINPVIGFEGELIPIDTPVYIIDKIDNDTSLVKIICYFDVPNSDMHFLKGYLFKKYLHEKKFVFDSKLNDSINRFRY